MRKRIIGIIVLLVLFFSQPLYSQIFKGMIIAGGNLTQIDGDESTGYSKLGLNTGLGVMAALDKQRNWLMSMEVLFNQLGSYEEYDPFNYNTTLNYASVPFLLHYEDKRGGWTFGAGLQYSRLFSVREDWGLPKDTILYFSRPDLNNLNDFKSEDISGVFDIRFRIWERLKFNFRYQYSLFAIRKDVVYFNGFPPVTYEFKTWKRDFYNNSMTLRLIYVINERSTKELDRNIRRNEY